MATSILSSLVDPALRPFVGFARLGICPTPPSSAHPIACPTQRKFGAISPRSSEHDKITTGSKFIQDMHVLSR